MGLEGNYVPLGSERKPDETNVETAPKSIVNIESKEQKEAFQQLLDLTLKVTEVMQKLESSGIKFSRNALYDSFNSKVADFKNNPRERKDVKMTESTDSMSFKLGQVHKAMGEVALTGYDLGFFDKEQMVKLGTQTVELYSNAIAADEKRWMDDKNRDTRAGAHTMFYGYIKDRKD